MQNDRTVFRNRIETKGLLVAYAVVFAPLFLLITISDALNKSPLLWRNLLSLTLGLLVFLFPVWIIARFRIVFDDKKQTVFYTPYFGNTKEWSYREIRAEYVPDRTINGFDFIFYHQNKHLFKISAIDFEGQTKHSSRELMCFFTGEAKSIFEWEEAFLKDERLVRVYSYQFKTLAGYIYAKKSFTFIEVTYSCNDCFHVEVSKFDKDPETRVLLDEAFVPWKTVKETCDRFIDQYFENETKSE